MNDDTQKLLSEAYQQLFKKSVQPIKACRMVEGINVLRESLSLDELIAYYETRAEELSNGEVNFYFQRYRKGKTLAIMADVLHVDMILGQIPDADNFDLNKFQISKYIPEVIEALKQEGIKAGIGAAFTRHAILLGVANYTVSVNDYQTDSLTVQMDIDGIDEGLQSKPEVILQAIDAFILKIVSVAKRLEEKYP